MAGKVGQTAKKAVKNQAKKLIKKKALKWVAIGGFSVIGPLILIIIIIFVGIGACASFSEAIKEMAVDEEFLVTCTDEDLSNALRFGKIKGRLTDEQLEDMMIDRSSLKTIVDHAIKYNNGAYFNDDYASVTLNEYANDYYERDRIESETKTQMVPGYEKGVNNEAFVPKNLYVEKTVYDTIWVEHTPTPAPKPRLVQNSESRYQNLSKERYLVQIDAAGNVGAIYDRFIPQVQQETSGEPLGEYIKVERTENVFIGTQYSSITYKSQFKYENGKYSTTPTNSPTNYIKVDKEKFNTANEDGYILVSECTDLRKPVKVTKYKILTERYHIDENGTNRNTEEKNAAGETVGYDYYISIEEDGVQTIDRLWEIKLSSEKIYMDYPVNWELMYLFSVYSYIDNDFETYGENVLTEDGTYENVKITVDREKLDSYLEGFLPRLSYAHTEDGKESNVMLALGEGLDKGVVGNFLDKVKLWLGRKFSSMSLSTEKFDVTFDDIAGLYTRDNASGKVLLRGGSPIIATVITNAGSNNTPEYHQITQVIDKDGNEELVDDKTRPIYHRYVLAVPYSTIESVQTITALYTYDEATRERELYYDLTGLKGLGIEDYSRYVEASSREEVERLLSKNALGTLNPSGAIFDTSILEEMLKELSVDGNERDKDAVIAALSELWQGKDIADIIEMAYEHNGDAIEETIQSVEKEKDIRIYRGTGGLKVD